MGNNIRVTRDDTFEIGGSKSSYLCSFVMADLANKASLFYPANFTIHTLTPLLCFSSIFEKLRTAIAQVMAPTTRSSRAAHSKLRAFNECKRFTTVSVKTTYITSEKGY